jgi:tyrosine-specific transport protein
MTTQENTHWFQISLLIAGISIGAGMLGIPLLIGAVGFIPGMIINTICWLLMLATGLLYLEASYWMPGNSHILSISQKFLGPVGKWVSGACFILLYYCLMVAYISGVSPIFSTAFEICFGIALPALQANILSSIVFAGIILLGTLFIEKINALLMLGLVISFILLLTQGITEFDVGNLMQAHWKAILIPAPVLFGAYGYHNIVPTVANLMRNSPQDAKKAVIVGSMIPFLFFSIWITFTLGICDEKMLQTALNQGIPITQAIQEHSQNSFVGKVSSFFTFFALVTSLIGVSFSILDFLRDAFCKYKGKRFDTLLCFAIFAPTTLIASIDPYVFIVFLGIAGGFGEAILNAIIPILIVWKGRYKFKQEGIVFLKGGKILLSILIIFTGLIIVLEAIKLLGECKIISPII